MGLRFSQCFWFRKFGISYEHRCWLCQSMDINFRLVFSAILVPMFGLIGVVLSRESLEHYLKPLGQKTAFALIAMMLLLLGPLGVLPRSLIVASGGVSLLFAQIPTSLIALMMVFLGYFLALSKNMVRLIGQYFTPLILLGILGIVLGALFLPLQINHAQQGSFWDALKTGYQTMDLIAALVFARALSSAFLKQFPKSARVEMMRAIVFGFFCLLCVYAFMVLVSSHLSDQLQFVAPEKRIVFIADLVMGDYARIISCFVIAAACMTTFAVLLREFIQFLHHFFPIGLYLSWHLWCVCSVIWDRLLALINWPVPLVLFCNLPILH